MFCTCGKLMTQSEIGYTCVCGIKKDFDGKILSESEAVSAKTEAEKIEEIKKKYHSKYPNMNDTLIRVTKPISEDETTDETFSSLSPKEAAKRRKNK